MKLFYTISRQDYRESLELYDSALKPTRWLSGFALPFACAALGHAIFGFGYGNRLLDVTLFLCAFFVLGKNFFLFLQPYLHYSSDSSHDPHYEAEITDTGVTFIGESHHTQKPWAEFLRYCETATVFVLLFRSHNFFVIPKRSFKLEEIEQLRKMLSSKAPPAVIRKEIRHFRPALALVLVGYIVFFFFGGTIERLIIPLVRPLLASRRPKDLGQWRQAKTASASQLNGTGTVYLVPIGDTKPLLRSSLIAFYKNHYGLSLHVLPSIAIPLWARDEPRQQVVAEELITAMNDRYSNLADDASSFLIGITDQDMYIAGLDWNFAFNMRQGLKSAVISTSRLNAKVGGNMPSQDLFEARLRKLLTKNIGLTYYRLDLSHVPTSVLYDDVEDMETLDGMADEYSEWDASTRKDDDDLEQEGDTCLSIRHYFSAEKLRSDAVELTGWCSSTHGQTDLEVINVYWRYGLLYTRRTEFYRPGALPLELSRVVRVADSSSRAFGIGANHSLNIWPIGNQWPFSWIDLILEDGGRLHYRRANWGASYWDAIYRVEYTITDFYDSALSWNGKGWTLSRQDGRTYLFPGESFIQRAEQDALVGVTDRSGAFLKFERERSGDLIRVTSNSGPWLQLQYDSQHRITLARDDSGRIIQYLYNDAGCLQEVDESEHITHYTYDKAKRLSGIEIDGRRVLTAEFQNSDRVTGLSVAGVGDYNFAYTVKPSGETKSVDITQPDSSVMHLDLTGSGYRLQKLSVRRSPEP